MSQVDSANTTLDKKQPVLLNMHTIKNYPEVHNRLLVGKELDTTESYVRFDCSTMVADKEGQVLFQDGEQLHPVGTGMCYEVRY